MALGLVAVALIAPGCRPRAVPPQPRVRLAEGAIRPGESFSFPLSLKARQYVQVAAEHRGIDVELSLWGPDGKRLATGGPVSQDGVEVLSAITRTAGVYSLRVSAPREAAAAARYRLFVEERRAVRSEDPSRVAAQKRLAEGLRDRAERNDLRRARLQLEEALRLWREAGDTRDEIDTQNEIGMTLVFLGEPSPALRRFESALAEARKVSYVRGQADAWNNLGIAYSRVGQPEAAVKAYRQAIEIWEILGDPVEQGKSFYNLGYLFRESLYDLAQAHQSFAEALRLRRSAGDRAGEAYALTGLGLVAESQADLEGALGCYNRALDLSRETGDRHLEAPILSNIAGIHLRRGKLQEALAFYDESLAHGGPGDRSQEEQILYNLASLYFALGEPEKALARYQHVLDLQQGDPTSTAFTLNSIGTVLSAMKDDSKAEEYFGRALKTSQEARSRSAEALALHNLGRLHLVLGRPAMALEELDRALALRSKLNDLSGQSFTLLETGIAQSDLHHPDQADASFRQALELARRIGARALISRCLLHQAMLSRDRDDLGTARQEIEQALGGVEAVRSDVSSDDLRTSFFAVQREYYEFYVDLLLRLAARDHQSMYQAKALEASENERARGLLDLLAEGRIDVDLGVDPELKRRQDALARELAWTEGQLKRAPQAAIPEATARRLEARLLEMDQQQHALVGEIRARNPRYAEVHYPTPLDAQKIEKLLDEKTALLEYAVGQEKTFLFVVTREGLAVYPLSLGAPVLADRVGRLRRALKSVNPALRADYLQTAADLYRDLLAPAAGSLAHKRDLLVSPDGILHLLPFEVLLTEAPSAGQSYSQLPYLLRRHAIAYIPSASVLAGLREPRKPPAGATERSSKAFLAFANPFYGSPESGPAALPALPGSEHEVETIAGLYPRRDVQLYVGREANRNHVIGNPLLEQALRIHFATHGVLDEQRPELSGLALARDRNQDDDSFLRVHDIFNLKLNADLVVLSACDTGGAQVTGEGLVGLTRAFFYAGASSLVVSLWRASEDSTPDLMARFYRQLAAGKAEALQAAKLEMISKGRYAHPFHWAPFVLVGDPR